MPQQENPIVNRNLTQSTSPPGTTLPPIGGAERQAAQQAGIAAGGRESPASHLLAIRPTPPITNSNLFKLENESVVLLHQPLTSDSGSTLPSGKYLIQHADSIRNGKMTFLTAIEVDNIDRGDCFGFAHKKQQSGALNAPVIAVPTSANNLLVSDPIFWLQGGWKVHIAIPDNQYAQRCEKIKTWLSERFVGAWKHMDGGEKHESDFTVTLGSHDHMMAFVKEFERSGLYQLAQPCPATTDKLVGDSKILGARFDTKKTAHERGNFDYYGSEGIPLAKEYRPGNYHDPVARKKAVGLSHELLKRNFGDYYLPTDSLQPIPASLSQSHAGAARLTNLTSAPPTQSQAHAQILSRRPPPPAPLRATLTPSPAVAPPQANPASAPATPQPQIPPSAKKPPPPAPAALRRNMTQTSAGSHQQAAPIPSATPATPQTPVSTPTKRPLPPHLLQEKLKIHQLQLHPKQPLFKHNQFPLQLLQFSLQLEDLLPHHRLHAETIAVALSQSQSSLPFLSHQYSLAPEILGMH